jgi:hypothetical protein
MEDGKKMIEHQQFVPYEYSFIGTTDTWGLLECTTFSGATIYRSWMNHEPKKK